MTVRNKTNLIAYVTGVLLDNNAGLISAADVRNSVVDTIESINTIVASGDFNSETPFSKHVRLKLNNPDGGILYVESGISFPNAAGSTDLQLVPYPGPVGIAHDSLGNLNTGDPHQQYLPVTGTRQMQGSLGMQNHWINSSGQSDPSSYNGYRGLQFSRVNPTGENINVGSGTSFVFLKDKSVINSARGVAKAWINFNASGSVPVINDSYNVSGLIKESPGHFVIVFHSGVFKNNDYAAIANSNATSSTTEFQKNTVGLVKRTLRDDGTRSIAFYVMDDGGQFCDARINDLVAYGTEPIGSGSPPVTVVVL